MKMRYLVFVFAASIALGGVCLALDSVKLVKGSMSGRVVGMSPTAVQLEQGADNGVSKEIPVNQIQTVFLEDEPTDLKTAKTHVLGGHYAEALAALERIKKNVTIKRPEIQQDIDFYKALCAAKTALEGNGRIADAGRLMKSFTDDNPNSYHHFEASEVVGDLLVAVGQYALAADYFARLDNAPWPDVQMRASVAAGRALLAQGKIDDAQKAFDKVIGNNAKGSLADEQRTLAKLGKAGALVAAKKPDEAVKTVEDILQAADPENAPVMARAYNVLGTAYRQGGRNKEAILAFLHVDLLYPSVAEAHAEALANLADLWEQDHKTERANEARKTLEKRYGESPWAKKGR
jgi:tetratricopeptide (TPR) repeat protein